MEKVMAGNQEVFKKEMDQGHSAAWDQAWDQAIEHYQKALEEFPNHPKALANLAMAYFELNRVEDALEYYQRAATAAPEDPLPSEKMAQIFERLGKLQSAIKMSNQSAELYLKNRDVDKAIGNYNNVINLDPDNLHAHTRLGLIYERLGRAEQSVNEYLAAASVMQRSGDLNKAKQAVEYCVQIAPNNKRAQDARQLLQKNQLLPKPIRARGATAPLRMAEVRQAETKLVAPAEETLEPVADARNKALVQLASLLFDQGEDSMSGGRSAGGTRGNAQLIALHLGQAVDSQSNGQDGQAAEELERAVEAGLKHPAVFFDLGLLLISRDAKKSLRYLQQCLAHPDYALTAYLLIGQIYRQTEDLQQAAAAFLQALRLADMCTVPLAQADELHQLYDPVIETITRQNEPEMLQRICNTVPDQLLRAGWRQYLQMARQQIPEQMASEIPIPLAEMLLQTNSSQVVEAIARVRSLANQNKFGSAMEEIFLAIQSSPTYLPLHTQLGELLFQRGLIREAVNKFAIVSRLHVLRGEAVPAIRLLSRIVQIAPMDSNARQNLIELLSSQGRGDEAAQEAINLAEFHYSLADLEKARQAYLKALPLAQRSHTNRGWGAQVLHKVADIDMQRLDWRQAIRVFEQIRTLEPEDIAARTRLVDLDFRLGQEKAALSEVDSFISLLENSGKLSKAVEFVQGLLAERSENIELCQRLAELYVHGGQIKKAIEEFDMIADLYLQAGDREAAIVTMERIIALNPPNSTEYQSALQKLKRG